MPEATHEITSCYFPRTGEVELTWKNLETGKSVFLTTRVDSKTGNKIAEVVPACVYHPAIVRENK